jgi:flagellar basal-body rod modification protein FlgD
MITNGMHALDASTNTRGTSNSNSNNSLTSTNGLNPNDFMSLLVAEIQNQDPTQPMDPTTFMSQLVNLNQLEQVTQINQVVQQFKTSSTTFSSGNTTT